MTAIRTLHQTLAIAAAGLALLAAAAGTPSPRDAEPFARAGADAEAAASTPRVVGARQLAAWIRDGEQPVRVLDLRGDSAYASRHVPSAEPADFARLDSLAAQRDQTLVLYSDDDVRDTQAWANLAALGHDRAYVLSGGMDAWTEEVMEAALRGDSADYVAALSRYFGGAPRREDAHPMSAAPPSPRVRADGERRETDAFGEPVRRGC
jgi:rhodanese-related sulfurtransferase